MGSLSQTRSAAWSGWVRPVREASCSLSTTTKRCDVMDQQRFNRLFVEHYQGIYRLLYRLSGGHQEAEDLAQEVFLRLHDHYESIASDKVKAWLYQVASNLGLNAIRGRKRRSSWTRMFAREQEWEAPATDPAKSLHVRHTLSELPERQAQLLMLYAAGLTRQEMADVLDVQPSSLGQLLLRAKKAFEWQYSSSSGQKL